MGPLLYSLILVLFLISLVPTILSQDPSSTSPTISQCTPSLIALTPCAQFVQGRAQSPPQVCCSNLKNLYSQQPHCLCLLLNNTNLSSFSINTTLAMQLPLLCSLQVNTSDCPGINVPSTSPSGSQVSHGTSPTPTLGADTNSTVAASPMVQVGPRPSIIGLGYGRSIATKLKTEGYFALMMTMAAFLLTKLLY